MVTLPRLKTLFRPIIYLKWHEIIYIHAFPKSISELNEKQLRTEIEPNLHVYVRVSLSLSLSFFLSLLPDNIYIYIYIYIYMVRKNYILNYNERKAGNKGSI